VDSNTRFWINISAVIAFGALFLFAGCYLISDYLARYYNPQNSRAFFAGAGGIVLGLAIIWKAIWWVQTTDPKVQPKTNVGPHFGAVIDES